MERRQERHGEGLEVEAQGNAKERFRDAPSRIGKRWKNIEMGEKNGAKKK